MPSRPSTVKIHPRFQRSRGEGVVSANERHLLELIRRDEGLSRADLTRSLGLSVPGAKRLIDGLVARGLICLGTPASKEGRGQPSASVSLVPQFAYSLGLSIMIDGYRLILMDFAGQVIAETSDSAFPLALPHVVSRVEADIDQMVAAFSIDRQAIFGLGLSMTGPFVGHGMRVNPPLSMPSEWASTELDRYFSERLDCPVWIDNDANCAAIAESIFGVGSQVNNFVYLHFTDGFGAGVVQQGKVWRGAHGNAGEIGRFFAMTPFQRPTLDALREKLAQDGCVFPSLQAMLLAYDPAWPQIDAWLEQVRLGLTITVAAITSLLDPEVIVFGARLPEDLARRLIAGVNFELNPRRGLGAPNPKLIIGQVARNVTAMGAAALPFKESFFQ